MEIKSIKKRNKTDPHLLSERERKGKRKSSREIGGGKGGREKMV